MSCFTAEAKRRSYCYADTGHADPLSVYAAVRRHMRLDKRYKPFVLEANWLVILPVLLGLAVLTGIAFSVAVGVRDLYGIAQMVALWVGTVAVASIVILVVAMLSGDPELWEKAVNAILERVLGIPKAQTGAEALLGKEAVVVSPFKKEGDVYLGQVRIEGETWTAMAAPEIATAPSMGEHLQVKSASRLSITVGKRTQ